MPTNNDEINALKIGDFISFEYGAEWQSRTIIGKVEKIHVNFIAIENQGEFFVSEIIRLNANKNDPDIDDNLDNAMLPVCSYNPDISDVSLSECVMINQTALIPKFVNYISFVAKQRGEQENYHAFEQKIEQRKRKMGDGLCLGFSIVHSYMAAHGKTEWWEKLLRSVAQWDGEETSLDRPIQNQDDFSSIYFDINERNERVHRSAVTYRECLERVASYVLYNSGDSIGSSVKNLQQSTFLYVNGPFVCEEGGIVFNRNFSGHYDEKRLEALLNVIRNAFFSDPPLESILLIKSDHAWSLRYDNISDRWFLYDPNDLEGEKKYRNLTELANQILQAVPSHNFSVEIASWKLPGGAEAGGGAAAEAELGSEALQLIARHYEAFYDVRNTVDLMKNGGLAIITRDAPDQAVNIIAYFTAHQQNLKTQFIEALNHLFFQGFPVLYFIVLYAPNQLSSLFELAAVDPDFKQGLITAFAVKNPEGWTVLEEVLNGPISDEIKNTAIEYHGGANAILTDIYANFQNRLYDCDDQYKKNLSCHVNYLLDKTPGMSASQNKPSLTIESLKMVKKMLGEGVLIGNRKYGIFSGKITPIKNPCLKKHVDARSTWNQQIITRRRRPKL